MDLSSLLKVDRPGPGLEALSRMGVQALDDPKASGADFRSFLSLLMLGAGINHQIQVNDCETAADWTESDDGTFDVDAGATGKRVGTNCVSLTGTAACDNSQYIQTLIINESSAVPLYSHKKQMDWRDTRYLGFWIHNESNGDFGTAGEMQVAIVNDGTVSDKVNVQALQDSVHQWFEIDMESNSWTRDKVEALRFYCNNANTGEVLYVDDIVRYEISYDRGPLYGCAFPIKSSEALTDGDSVRWTVDGLAKWTSAANVADLGAVKLFDQGVPTSSVTGDGARSKWGVIPGVFLTIARANAATVAGEGLQIDANGLYGGVATGVDEKSVAKGLEAAGAQYDDIFVLRGVDTSFIS